MPSSKVPPSIDVPAKATGFDVREVGRALVYCRDGHRELAPKVAAFAAEALAWAPADARLGFIDAEGEWSTPTSREALIEHAATAPEGTFMIGDRDRAQYFAVEYHGTEHGKKGDEASWFSVKLPRARLYEPEIAGWFSRFLATVPFSCGTLGLALVGAGLKLLPLQRTYRALDVAIPNSINVDLGDRVAGIGWLTALGKSVVSELGGMDVISEVLGSSVPMERVGDGVVLRLGEAPARGGANDDLSAYEAVATMLDAEDLVHVPRRVLYMSYDGAYGRDFRERAVAAQNAWHLRFVKSATSTKT